jgi:hypothetical protein
MTASRDFRVTTAASDLRLGLFESSERSQSRPKQAHQQPISGWMVSGVGACP